MLLNLCTQLHLERTRHDAAKGGKCSCNVVFNSLCKYMEINFSSGEVSEGEGLHMYMY